MNYQELASKHGISVSALREIINAAVEYAEENMSLNHDNTHNKIRSEEAESALWLVRNFAEGDDEYEYD